MTEHYNQLKSIIQKANPEIMELKFGCEIRGMGFYAYGLSDRNNGDLVGYATSLGRFDGNLNNDEILGRPIRLADVLLAIGEKWVMVSNNSFPQQVVEVFNKWNLRDDNLDHQSEECKHFLIDLLT